MIINRKAPYMA